MHIKALSPYLLIVFLLFVEIVLYGANRTDLSLLFAALWFLALALMLLSRSARRELDGISLAAVAAPFGLLILILLVQLVPAPRAWADPVWTWVPGTLSPITIDPYATRVEIIKLVALAAVFLLGVLAGRDDDRAKAFIRALLAFGLIYSAWSLVDHAMNFEFPFGYVRLSGPARLSASLVSANSAASLFGVLAILNLIDLTRRLERLQYAAKVDLRLSERLAPSVAVPVVGLAASISSLVLTQSRTGLAVTLGLCVLLVGGLGQAQARKRSLSVAMAATAVILGGIVVVTLSMNLGELAQRLSLTGLQPGVS